MLLTGTFPRSLDDKQRLAIPKPLRESLGYPTNSVFFLAPGTDGSLAFYSELVFTRLAEQMDATSPNSQDVRAFNRLFFAQAQRVEIDRQGRMRIPAELAHLAGLGREIVLIGVRDHVEIWNRSQWDRYLTQQQARYDEIAETATAQGGGHKLEHESAPEVRPLQPR
ncbi:MAG: division/cell wall cluster transcriptional repressor MraZ [Pirellulaceae bacterium]